MWEYMEVIRQAAEPKCADHLQKSIETIDDILGKPFSKTLKGLFGLRGLQHDEDFAALIAVCFPAYLQFLMNAYSTVCYSRHHSRSGKLKIGIPKSGTTNLKNSVWNSHDHHLDGTRWLPISRMVTTAGWLRSPGALLSILLC